MESVEGHRVPNPETVPSTTAMHETLDNESLLDNIFETVEDSSTELKTFRLVSKKWKSRATFCLRKKNWENRNFLRLIGNEDLMKYANTLNPSIPFDTESEFLQYGRLALESELQSASLNESQLFECYEIIFQLKQHNPEISLMFFGLFPQSIKSLDLTIPICRDQDLGLGVDKSDIGLLDEFLLRQCTSLSELKLHAMIHDDNRMKFMPIPEGKEYKLVNLDYLCIKISFRNSSVSSSANGSNFVLKFLENLLNKIPNGKLMKICLLDWKFMKEAAIMLKKYEQVKSLKVLDIDISGDLKELKILSECECDEPVRLRLHLLNVDNTRGGYGYVNDTYVSDFLGSQCTSLKQLKWASLQRFKFPANPMVALKWLKLVFWIKERLTEDFLAVWNENCGPIFYADLFPQLEELHFWIPFALTVEKFNSWFLPPQLPCTSVKILKINYNSGLNSEILTSITNIFTHLKYLKIDKYSLDSKIEEQEFFHTLWGAQFACTMEELYIEMSICEEQVQTGENWRKYELDNLFTGVGENIIQQVTESGDYSPCSSSNSTLNYRNLKTLTIIDRIDDIVRKQGVFTGFSTYCLFIKLEKLGFLHLSKGMWNFSKDAGFNLQKKLSQASSFHNPSSTSSATAKTKLREHFFCDNIEILHYPHVGKQVSTVFCDLDLNSDA